MLAAANTTVCSCPTTERNLGDGVLAADQLMRKHIRITLGSDSQAQIDPLEDARELEYHLRLEHQQRAILDQIDGQPLGSRLFDCATVNGARALSVSGNDDCFTVDLDDVSIAGQALDDLLPMAVFSLNRSAIRDVRVNGQWVIRDQRHPLQEEIIARYKELHSRVWAK